MTSKYFAQNLFGIKGLNIAWYGVIIGCGILIGTIIAGREAKSLDFIRKITGGI